MSFDALLASFAPKALKTDAIVFSSPDYTPHELSAMGWRWAPILRARTRVECSMCRFKTEVVPHISDRHVAAQQNCPLAQIWAARERAAAEGWQNVELFAHPNNKEGISVRLATFKRRRGGSWCNNGDAPFPETLARCGFYYDSKVQGDDRCTCMYCGVHIEGWTASEEVDIEVAHLGASEDCWVWHAMRKQGDRTNKESQTEQRLYAPPVEPTSQHVSPKIPNEPIQEYTDKTQHESNIPHTAQNLAISNPRSSTTPQNFKDTQVEAEHHNTKGNDGDELRSSLRRKPLGASNVIPTNAKNYRIGHTTQKEPVRLSAVATRAATFNAQKVDGHIIEFKGTVYPRNVLANMGWVWKPTLTAQLRMQCYHCGAYCEARGDVCLQHVNKSPECPFALIMAAIERNMVNRESWHNDDKFRDPRSEESMVVRLDTFPDERWCSNENAPHPAQLAANGFYYNPKIPNDDRCTCMYCGLDLLEWEGGGENEIREGHEKESRDCYVVHKELVTDDIPDFAPASPIFPASTPPSKHRGTSDDPIDLDYTNAEADTPPVDLALQIVEPDELDELDGTSPERPPAVFPTLKSTDLSEFFSELDVDSSEKRPKSYFKRLGRKDRGLQEGSQPTVGYEEFARFETDPVDQPAVEQVTKDVGNGTEGPAEEPARMPTENSPAEIHVEKSVEEPGNEAQGLELPMESPRSPVIIAQQEQVTDIEANKETPAQQPPHPPMTEAQSGTANNTAIHDPEAAITTPSSKTGRDEKDTRIQMLEEALASLKRQFSEFHAKETAMDEVANTYDDIKAESLPAKTAESTKLKATLLPAVPAETTDDLLSVSIDAKEAKRRRKRERRERRERKERKRQKKGIQSQTQSQSQPVPQIVETVEAVEDPIEQVPVLPSSEINLVDPTLPAITPNQGHGQPQSHAHPATLGVPTLHSDTEEASPTLQKSLGRAGDSVHQQLSIRDGRVESLANLDKLMMLSPRTNMVSSSPAPPSHKRTEMAVDGDFSLTNLNQSTPHRPIQNQVPPEPSISTSKYAALYSDLALDVAYVQRVCEAPCDMLSHDLDGELTDFVANLDPEQLQMTIREWFLYHQNAAEALVRARAEEMRQLFSQQCQRALDRLEEL